MKILSDIVAQNRSNATQGIYAVCTANPIVLEAAFRQAKLDDSSLLIEATANQVNQFGGYTGMMPKDFMSFLNTIADRAEFNKDRIILGGDHLGPVCWTDEPAEMAMEKSSELIKQYVEAGFKKIHLDTSMPCLDDTEVLSDEIVASRAASLCMVAEETAVKQFGESDLLYVIGTEVPPPGGASELLDNVVVTPADNAKKTIEIHQKAFLYLGLESAWSRVIGLVVQPGVEFDHTSVHDFDVSQTKELTAFIKQVPNMVYEAHSTDYQPVSAYAKLVNGHFAILKVGPQLTFALREALFALSHIEDELVAANESSKLREICEETMIDSPKYWEKYYESEKQEKVYRRYSYSDRIRYYWNQPKMLSAVGTLIQNLSNLDLPLPLISQYLPLQYAAIRAGTLKNSPEALIRYHIMQVLKTYSLACVSDEKAARQDLLGRDVA